MSMNFDTIILFATVIGVIFLVILGFFLLFKAFYIKVPQGTALIVNDMSSKPKVYFTGALVYPVIHKKEFMKISLITFDVERRGKDGLICKDNLRADICVAFYLRVNETTEDVLKVAKSIGVDRASDQKAVSSLFSAKFSEALKTVGKQFELAKLFEDRLNFRERIIDVIGKDLNGYALEDVAIDYLEQTPIKALDPDNIFDAEGINKITSITAIHKDETNKRERDLELALKKKDTETIEAKLELERQQADAEARQKREIETIRAREMAETLKVQEEERLKAEQARIQSQQEIEVREENRLREVEVAQQNRLRAIAIEEERVQRARSLEIVAREREVELQRIEKDKVLEEEKKTIANVIRERVAVEKTVAVEEENIKEVREVSRADREKQTTIIEAEARAEQELVKQVKQAEADEKASKYRAVEISTIAQAELEAAAKQSEAKKQLAQGIEAEEAAIGLAEAKVRKARAEAEEKEGLVKANIKAETLLAEAKGCQEVGLSEAKVIEAKAIATEKQGLTEAKILEEKLSAQARGDERIGLAKATATKEQGLAEALVIRERLTAEASGLVEKFQAMATMSEQSQSHEEFRLALEKSFEQAIAAIAANKEIAKEQAEVLAAAFSKANIEIVGGNDNFFNSFSKAISVGKAIEGTVNQSPVLQSALQSVLSRLSGNKNVNLKETLENTDLKALAKQFLSSDSKDSEQDH
ncbi:hypothetical protein J3U44_10115 [Gilliamella sp. B3766]|nr:MULTISPECIES: hypothetical protein [unclassified Gilliamella]MCX8602234.1 hypothetical protein [Gilliamella sp. B3722]MCX8607218.1 hypothetical protein [Gilliamella sp. B3771]MCX8611504.1 hypothetical protein [Gilliamella sp. B3891]MCX8613974.1 hypothetical protein [Gilliamella sp. B3773]MCX8614950.1 hypothetical protein [Gilliamella sp. B3770]